MSAVNPYESPAEESATPADPLELPALGYMLLGALGLILGLGMLVKSDVFVLNPIHMSRWAWRDLGLGLAQLLVAAMFFLAARLLRSRKYKWLIVAVSILGSAECIPLPLAALTLMRLFRKEVWRSFEPPS